LTNQVTDISFSAIIQKAYVLILEKIGDLHTWVNASSQHFFTQYSFPTIYESYWSQKEILDSSEVHACLPCLTHRKETLLMEVKQATQPQLRALDLFAGTGAFSLGMKAAGAPFKLTHAVEISPSAAKSLRYILLIYNWVTF
jgi:DNA (cytosine-5)-methyltransferase 1